MRYLLTLPLVFSLLACSTQMVPKPQVGMPTAQLNDRLTSDDDDSNPRAFALVAIDGVPVMNLLKNSRRPSFGAGPSFVPYLIARTVEAKPSVYTIAGSHITRAPINTLINSMRCKFQSVEGSVSFTPKNDAIYRVNGILLPEESAVWIEDFDTGVIVSEKIHATNNNCNSQS